jgi:hypothetical protein
MEFLLLIYHREQEYEKLPADQREPMHTEYRKLMEELGRKGKLRGGNQLAATKLAKTMRVRRGKQGLTDGPFAETKEQLGGYFLVDVADIEEAIEIAGRIPGAREGSVEVRPVIPRGQ